MLSELTDYKQLGYDFLPCSQIENAENKAVPSGNQG